jgi:hypothetical protein
MSECYDNNLPSLFKDEHKTVWKVIKIDENVVGLQNSRGVYYNDVIENKGRLFFLTNYGPGVKERIELRVRTYTPNSLTIVRKSTKTKHPYCWDKWEVDESIKATF